MALGIISGSGCFIGLLIGAVFQKMRTDTGTGAIQAANNAYRLFEEDE
jgi:hypothetical protein